MVEQLKIRLADQKTVLESSEELQAIVDLDGAAGTKHCAQLDLVVWSMPGMDLIIGLPNITNHFREKMIQMISSMDEVLVSDLQSGDIIQ